MIHGCRSPQSCILPSSAASLCCGVRPPSGREPSAWAPARKASQAGAGQYWCSTRRARPLAAGRLAAAWPPGREVAVLQGLARGLSTKALAVELGISRRTLAEYVPRIDASSASGGRPGDRHRLGGGRRLIPTRRPFEPPKGSNNGRQDGRQEAQAAPSTPADRASSARPQGRGRKRATVSFSVHRPRGDQNLTALRRIHARVMSRAPISPGRAVRRGRSVRHGGPRRGAPAVGAADLAARRRLRPHHRVGADRRRRRQRVERDPPADEKAQG